MDRFGGITFSLIFAGLGWAFAPFDTQPVAAPVVACLVTLIGLCSALYFLLRKSDL